MPPEDDSRWRLTDEYFERHLCGEDPALRDVLARNAAAGLPNHDVSTLQGSFLNLLARATGAQRILEIGTLGGYSTIWFARAVGATGKVITLEANAHHAETARHNLQAAGVADRVEVVHGPALESLSQLALANAPAFDLIFIDADKPNNPGYLERSLELARKGTLIIADNVVRDGQVIEDGSTDPRVVGVRRFIDAVGQNPRLGATVLQTVGAKGWDGFAMLLVD